MGIALVLGIAAVLLVTVGLISRRRGRTLRDALPAYFSPEQRRAAMKANRSQRRNFSSGAAWGYSGGFDGGGHHGGGFDCGGGFDGGGGDGGGGSC